MQLEVRPGDLPEVGGATCSSAAPATAPELTLAPWLDEAGAGEDIWARHPFWDQAPADLVAHARATAGSGVRDPFYWRAVRLRARAAAPSLSVKDLAVLLTSCLQAAPTGSVDGLCRECWEHASVVQ